MDLITFESLFESRVKKVCDEHPDPSHDWLHVQRVVHNARLLSKSEKADLAIVIPAAYLHDIVYISKTDSRRSQASRLSAIEARKYLNEIHYPENYLEGICQAIEAHSFSAAIEAPSLEAKVVQDADRLDALGAIGIARCLAFSGLALRPLYSATDPFAVQRELNDSQNTLDHFFVKLLKLPEKMQTSSGKEEAKLRLHIMNSYIEALKRELLH